MVRILVIEDDSTIRNQISLLLEESGYSVSAASSGEEGLKLCRESDPDVILCDILLPGISGFDVLAILTEENELTDRVFIFITAKGELHDIRNGMTLGADDYLVKPFRAKELIDAINTRIRKRRQIACSKENSTEEEKSSSDDLHAHNYLNSNARAKASDELPINNSSDKPDSNENTRKKQEDYVLLNVNNKPKLIKINQIVCIQAEKDYTRIILSRTERFLVCKPIKKWEESLPKSNFIRIHRSTIVNLDYLEKIEKWYKRSYRISLRNISDSFLISQRYYTQVREKLSI